MNLQNRVKSRVQWAPIAVMLGFFVLAAVVVAQRRDIKVGYDEIAHLSYVAHIQRTGDIWPSFEAMRLLDPLTFRFTAQANYLNHPPLFYQLLAHAGPTIEDNPDALMTHRLLNILLATIGLAAALALGFVVGRTRLEAYAYCVPVACIPVLAQLAGEINNDILAFTGGAATTLAAYQLLAAGRTGWLLAALTGVVVVAFAKLTGLLLAGGLVVGVLAYLLWRRRFRQGWTIPVVIAGLLAAAPYVYLTMLHGTPAPTTPGQVLLLRTHAEAAGWAEAPRRSLPAFAASFVTNFFVNWLQSVEPRNAIQYGALALPFASVLFGLAGLRHSAYRIVRGQESAIDVIVAAGWVALAGTFVCHLVFSYRHHLSFGAIPDAFPRYYLPLAGVVPLAGVSLLKAASHPKSHALLTSVLILAPILYLLIGSPIQL